jgi:hypothetical protein
MAQKYFEKKEKKTFSEALLVLALLEGVEEKDLFRFMPRPAYNSEATVALA